MPAKRGYGGMLRDKELAEVGWATFRISEDGLKILSKNSLTKDTLNKLLEMHL